jgi:hypothetical protein
MGTDHWPLVGVSHGVTWAIDACYTTLDAAQSPSLTRGGVAAGELSARMRAAIAAAGPGVLTSGLLHMWQNAIYGRVMLGSRPWGLTWRTPVGGRTRGAFTFALTTLIQQWTPDRHNDVQYITASYGDLMERSQALLDALGVAQRPTLVGLPRLELQASSGANARNWLGSSPLSSARARSSWYGSTKPSWPPGRIEWVTARSQIRPRSLSPGGSV